MHRTGSMFRMNKPMPWYHSVAVKSYLVAFVATHIPLLGLIAVIVLWPGLLSPWGVFLAALVFTLAATALVVGVLWRMFKPLRAAADGLKGFMTQGSSFKATPATADEIGRLTGILVQALAHLDRSRGALLHSSSITVGHASAEVLHASLDNRQWLVLLEIDQWAALDGRGGLDAMLHWHRALDRAVDKLLQAGELALPWGRGRFLLMLAGSNADVVERLDTVCRGVAADDGQVSTATAAVDVPGPDAQSRAAALQRLEHKLFALRLQGSQAAVA